MSIALLAQQKGMIFKMEIIQGLGVVLALAAVIFLSYIFTKFIGGKANRSMKGKYINIIETISLGMDKHIHLVRVGEQFVLLASSGKNIEFLTAVKLDEMEISELAENGESFDFKHLLEKYVKGFRTKEIDNSSEMEVENNQSMFNSRSFENNLSKLKNITERINNKV